MARQKDTFYFDGFRRSADYACQAAKLLSEVMHDFNPGQLRERMDSMHAIEKSADEVRHDMMDELVTAFITPFDREDIDELGHVLDDVTDSIEGVLNRMYYDNVTDMRDDAVQMSDMVVRATESICELVNELPRFRHSKTLRELVFAKATQGAARSIALQTFDKTAQILNQSVFKHQKFLCAHHFLCLYAV